MKLVDSNRYSLPLTKNYSLGKTSMLTTMCFSVNEPNQQGALFDPDGTLIDTAPDMIYALKTVLENNHTNTSTLIKL